MTLKFEKTKRLLTEADFRRVFSFSHKKRRPNPYILRGEDYVVYWRPAEEPRLGLSLAKKVIRRANRRNRVKRCLREYFRQEAESLGAEMIVRFVKEPKDYDFETLTQPLATLQKKRGRET